MCSAIMELSKDKITGSVSPLEMDRLKHGGDSGIRTRDLLLAKQALYQLSYVPLSCDLGSSVWWA